MNVYMDDLRLGPYNDAVFGGFEWQDYVIVRSIANTKELLSSGLVFDLSLDHDMGSELTGYDLVKWMADTNTWPKGKMFIHTANPVGRNNMVATIKQHRPDLLE